MIKQQIQKRVQEWLDKEEIVYKFDEEEFAFGVELDLSDSDASIMLVISVNNNDCELDFYLPIAEVSDVGELAHFIMNVNNGVRNGSYKYDFEDDQISYHIFINLAGDAVLTDEMINRALRGGWYGVDKLYYYFTSIINGSLSSRDALNLLNDSDDESTCDSSPKDIRYEIEHEYLPVEFMMNTSALLNELENKENLFKIYSQHFESHNINCPYSVEDFEIFNRCMSSYHIKRLVLPETDEKCICNEIYLVYAESPNEIEDREKRYFTLEYDSGGRKSKNMLCEWCFNEDEDCWEHENHGAVPSNIENIYKTIQNTMGL